MIDLHCHLLPGVDDGARDLAMSLSMARIATQDGISVLACTPHIMPSVYENVGPDIQLRVEQLQQSIDEQGIPLRLVSGADVHIAPDVLEGLRSGRVLPLNGSRYLLLEPPHHVLPPQLDLHIFQLHISGYTAILTHPERLSWIESHYAVIQNLVQKGVWIQLTAGSLTGRFGRRPHYWAERMLNEGLCHVLATDAHNVTKRPPLLAEAWAVAADRLGAEEASHLVITRPQGVIENVSPAALPPLPYRSSHSETKAAVGDSRWSRFLGRVRGL